MINLIDKNSVRGPQFDIKYPEEVRRDRLKYLLKGVSSKGFGAKSHTPVNRETGLNNIKGLQNPESVSN